MEWQPLTTAPRDGTRFLVWSDFMGGKYRFMSWGLKFGTKTKYGFSFDHGIRKIVRQPEELPEYMWHPLPPPPR